MAARRLCRIYGWTMIPSHSSAAGRGTEMRRIGNRLTKDDTVKGFTGLVPRTIVLKSVISG